MCEDSHVKRISYGLPLKSRGLQVKNVTTLCREFFLEKCSRNMAQNYADAIWLYSPELFGKPDIYLFDVHLLGGQR